MSVLDSPMTSTSEPRLPLFRVKVAFVASPRMAAAKTYSESPWILVRTSTGTAVLDDATKTALTASGEFSAGASERTWTLIVATLSFISGSASNAASAKKGYQEWQKYPNPLAPWISAIQTSALTWAGVGF